MVDDDAFVQRDSGFWTWRGDCVQLGLARSASAGGGGNGWADLLETACSEIDLALAPDGPEAYRTITFDAGRFPSDTAGAGQIDSAEMPLDVALEARADGGIRLRYSAVVPWAFAPSRAPTASRSLAPMAKRCNSSRKGQPSLPPRAAGS